MIQKLIQYGVYSQRLNEFPGKSLTTSSIYSAIYDFIKADEYVSAKLLSLKDSKGLIESKVEEIISHLCTIY